MASAGVEAARGRSGETSRMSERRQGTPPVVTQAEEGSVESSLTNTHSGETGIPTTSVDGAVHAEEWGDAHNVGGHTLIVRKAERGQLNQATAAPMHP